MTVPKLYPFKPPTLQAKQPIYHPNVELSTGRVALQVLGHGWRPVLSVGGVILCLEMMFLEPSVEGPAGGQDGGECSDEGDDDGMPLSQGERYGVGDNHGLSLPPPPPSLVLNPAAYATFKDNPEEFENQVRCTLSGGYHFLAEFRDAYGGAVAAADFGGGGGIEGMGETPRKKGKRKYR